MKKIVIILALPIEYNTSSMIRCRNIISALARMKYVIKCYCPKPDTTSKYYNNTFNDIPGIEIVRFKRKVYQKPENLMAHQRKTIRTIIKQFCVKLFRRFDLFGSTLLYVQEKKWIAKEISKENYDFLLSFSDPMPAHMIANYCKRFNPYLNYIQQWGDPLTTDSISKNNQPVWIKKIIEKKMLAPADKVCYVSPFTCEEQKKIFPSYAKKMFFLPTPSLEYNEDANVGNKKVCIGYFGSYYSAARNLLPFYQAVKKNKEIECYIIGDSDVVLETTDNVNVIQRLGLDELNVYINKINVIVCLMNKKGNQIPGKVYHDASSSKDILFIKDGEYGDAIQNFFDKYNHYTFVNNDVESINNAIKKYITNGVPKRKSVDDFKAENIAKRLIEG